MSQDKSSQPYCHMTNHHTNILSQDKSSQGLIVKGQMVTGTFCYSEKTSHGYFVTWAYRQSTYRHTEILSPNILSQYELPHISSQDKSLHGHIVTRHFVTVQNAIRTYCHKTNRHITYRHKVYFHTDRNHRKNKKI